MFPDADPGPNGKYVMFAIYPRVRLAVALRTLAGAKLLDLWWPYCIGQSSVYSVFHDILRRSCTYLDNVKFPSSEDECKAAADGFQNLRDSPLWGIVAALDGISVAIKCPTLDDTPSPNFFYNRKGFYSVCVQAACDASYKFSFFSASNAGSTHDSTAFQTSVLHTHLQKAADDGGLPDFATVAADDAYGNGTCGGRILTPCSGRNLSSAMDTFNFFLSSNRITIEQAFGVLVSRFGILWSPLGFSLATNILIIESCIRFHNFIIDRRKERSGSETGAVSLFGDIEAVHDENYVDGSPDIFLQNYYHREKNVNRIRLNVDSERRNKIARDLILCGYCRPGTLCRERYRRNE